MIGQHASTQHREAGINKSLLDEIGAVAAM